MAVGQPGRLPRLAEESRTGGGFWRSATIGYDRRSMSASPTAIICLDLDGTSIDFDDVHVWFSDDVADQLNQAVRRGAVWCPNSGRRADNQLGLIQACRRLESMPFAILAGERYIFDIQPKHYAMSPRRPYNDRSARKVRELMPQVIEKLAPRLDDIQARFDITQYLQDDEIVGWYLADAMDPTLFAEEIARHVASVPGAQVLRNGRWVVVTHADFGKGRLLRHVASGLDVPRERILAIGDQPNDLDMLDGHSAAYVGCPSDADAEVQALVKRSGGWIADEPSSQGTVSLIQRFIKEVLD